MAKLLYQPLAEAKVVDVLVREWSKVVRHVFVFVAHVHDPDFRALGLDRLGGVLGVHDHGDVVAIPVTQNRVGIQPD
eukprot:3862259-Prorocentrum_lima.AAC.1